MHKVFYASSIADGDIIYGTATTIDGEYIKVNDQLIHRAFIFLDTQENIKLLREFREEYQAWKNMEPNVYALTNKMQRPKVS